MGSSDSVPEINKAMPRKSRAVKMGRVVSNGMNKSVVVAVDRLFEHRLYGKTIRRTSKFMAHDEQNECQVGDKVKIEETRPMSKRKRWIIQEIVEKKKG